MRGEEEEEGRKEACPSSELCLQPAGRARGSVSCVSPVKQRLLQTGLINIALRQVSAPGRRGQVGRRAGEGLAGSETLPPGRLRVSPAGGFIPNACVCCARAPCAGACGARGFLQFSSDSPVLSSASKIPLLFNFN